MRIKSGAKLLGITPQIIIGASVADELYREMGFDMRITCGTDGKHMTGSAHYEGNAIDLGVIGLSTAQVITVVKELKARLGPEFDVVNESDHIHVEWDPK